METFKMELVGWFSELCSAAFGTGDKKETTMGAWLVSSCPVLILKLKDNCPHH